MNKYILLVFLFIGFYTSVFAQPSNDNICSAISLTANASFCNGTNTNGDNTNATVDGVAGTCWFGGDGVQNDIWYSIVVPFGFNNLDFSTNFGGGSNTDTQLTIFSSNDNTCTGTLTQEACNDDAVSGGLLSFASIADLAASGIMPGDVLFIQVDGYNGTVGSFCVEITGIDLCDPNAIDAGIDANVCDGSSIDITATLGVVPSTTYTVSNPTCTVATPNGAVNNLNLGDDSGSGAIPIGFTFSFFGIDYTNLYVGSNGFISFINSSVNSRFDSQIPNATDPDAIIALFWDDLNPAQGGTIRTFTSTVNGQSCFVIDFDDVLHYFAGPESVTGQIIICPDGTIIINCIDCETDGGDNATQGIENEDGTAGYFDATSNNGQFNSDQTNCVQFTPEGCDFVRWSTDLSDIVGSSIATTETTSVSPTTTTTYYAIVDCNGVLCVDEVTITVDPIPDLSVTSPVSNTCPTTTVDITNTTITGLADANSTTGTISYHTVNNPANATDQTVGTPTALAAGTYYIRKETASGCIDIIPITVNIVICCDITINSLTPTNESCFQEEDGSISVVATCNSCAASTDIRYSIAPDPNSVSPQTNNTFSNLPPNNYTITAFDVNDNTCSDNGNTAIAAASEIMLMANGNSPVCEGSNIELMATFTANGTSTSAASWSWTGPGFMSTDEDPTPFASALANSGAFNVTVTDNNNCTASETVNILVDEMATVDLSGINTNLCYKLGTETIDLSSDYISGATNIGTWSSSGDGTFDDASNLHPAVTAYNTSVQDRSNANVTLTLTADPANACPVADDNISIIINDVSCTNTTPFSGNNN